MNRERTIQGSDNLIVVDRSQRRRRIAMIGGIVAVIVILLAAFLLFRANASEKTTAAAAAANGGGKGQIPTVTVIVPGRSNIVRTVSATGALAARRDQPVGIAGGGGRVTNVMVDAGNWVRAGQVLATVERSVQTEVAAQQQAQIAAARANADLAQNNYDRAQGLVSRGFVSKADLDAKRAARDAALAQVRVAQAQLGQTRAQIGQLNVRAPAAGLVLARNVEVGQIVSPASGALFRLAAGGAVEMRAQLAQQDIALVHVGMPATVTPVGLQRSFAGTIWQVAPVIDPQSRQGEVRIAIPFDSAIRPGGFAEAKIAAGSSSAPLLPQSAVLSDAQGNYVYIVGAGNKAERRSIKVGAVDEQGVTVAEGLSGQEPVVLSAGPFLNPGQKIAPRRQAAH